MIIPLTQPSIRASFLAVAYGLIGFSARAQNNYAPPYYFTTIAGSPGQAGFVNGTGPAARFSALQGLAIEPSGGIYVADYGNNAVRKIGPGGAVSTLVALPAGMFVPRLGPASVAVAPSGAVLVASYGRHRISSVSSGGAATTLAGYDVAGLVSAGFVDGTGTNAKFNTPYGIAVDASGNSYVGDEGNNAIRRISPSGTVSTIAGSLAGAPGSADGNVLVARFTAPRGVAIDSDLTIYVADWGNHTIRRISGGVTSTLAGLAGNPGSKDGTGSTARFRNPISVVVDAAKNVYVADFGNHLIRRITPAGVVTTLAGSAGVTGSADGLGNAARFNAPGGIAIDASGNLYVSDYSNATVRMSVAQPSITQQPASQLAPAGSTVVFSTTATGQNPYAPLAYQWRKDGVALAGATTATITLLNVQLPNAGGYSVVITNPAGSVTSATAQLTLSLEPAFTLQPASQSMPPGTTAAFSVTTTSATPVTYQWQKDGASIPDATTAALIIPNVQAANLGNYTVVATNTIGSATSAIATLSLLLPPVFSTQPVSQAVPPGATVTFSSAVTGTTATTYQWRKDGVPISGATDPAIVIANVQAANTGTYAVIATNAGGSRVSDAATLSLLTLPVITTQPASQSAVPGQSVTLIVVAAGSGTIAFQWRKDGVAISGANAASLVLGNVQVADLGSYTVVATNAVGSATSNAAVLSFAATNAGRLVNLSIRTNAGSGPQTLIVGLVIGGANIAGTKPLLIRGIGPTLAAFGVGGFLVDPTLSVFSGTTVIASNDNWGGDAQVTAIGNQVGAFVLGVNVSRDAALYHAGLQPGAYTVQISGVGGATGVTLAEIYDATPVNAFLATTPRLVNVSARTQVGTGAEILIAGFAIGGTTSRTLLIRAVGPTLSAFGVTGALADPRLELFSGTTSLQSNDNWGGGALITGAAAGVGAFALEAASRDAVLLVTLQPGSYTAQVSGVGNATGVALIEIYEVP